MENKNNFEWKIYGKSFEYYSHGPNFYGLIESYHTILDGKPLINYNGRIVGAYTPTILTTVLSEAIEFVESEIGRLLGEERP